MKKIIVFLVLLITIPLFSKGIDFSVGGSYGFGYKYSFMTLCGIYNNVMIPISFSFYPGNSDLFSFGFKNKLGYGTIVYSNSYTISKHFEDKKETHLYGFINYDSYPLETEILENVNFLFKVGKSIKFVAAIGCTAKCSFLSISEGNFTLTEYDITYITPGFYNYFSIGPSVALSLELINKPKTYSMNIGIPVEVLLPMNRINFTKKNINSYWDNNIGFLGGYNKTVTKERFDNMSWYNLSVGFEISFNFYTYKQLE